MGLPSDNLHGYEQGQLLNKVDNIKTKMYYLIHGTLDDNVHYQQSLLLAKVLEQKDILFRQQVRYSEDFRLFLKMSEAQIYVKEKKKTGTCHFASYYFKKLTKLLCLAFIYVLPARFMEFNIHD